MFGFGKKSKDISDPFAIASPLPSRYSSRILPTSQAIAQRDLHNVAELLYLHLVAIQLLSVDPLTNGAAVAYARHSIFQTKSPRVSDLSKYNDLQLLVAICNNIGGSAYMLRDENMTTRLLSNLTMDTTKFDIFLSQLISGSPSNKERNAHYLVNIAPALGVRTHDYVVIGQALRSWHNWTYHEYRDTVTRLLHAFRHRCPKSQLLPSLEHLARSRGLEIHNAWNSETGLAPKPSLADSLLGIAAGVYVGSKLADVLSPKNKKNKGK